MPHGIAKERGGDGRATRGFSIFLRLSRGLKDASDDGSRGDRD